MQIRVRNEGGDDTRVEVVDPTDGAVAQNAIVAEGEQVVVTIPSVHSPAGIEFHGPESTADAEGDDGDDAGAGTPTGHPDALAQTGEGEQPDEGADDDEADAAGGSSD